jgi:hypothetical protein
VTSSLGFFNCIVVLFFMFHDNYFYCHFSKFRFWFYLLVQLFIPNWFAILLVCQFCMSFDLYFVIFRYHLLFIPFCYDNVVLFRSSYKCNLCFEDDHWTSMWEGECCHWAFKCLTSCCEEHNIYLDTKYWNFKFCDFWFIKWSWHHFLELYRWVECIVGYDVTIQEETIDYDQCWWALV